MKQLPLFALLSSALLFSGCASLENKEKIKETVNKEEVASAKVLEAAGTRSALNPKIVVSKRAYIPAQRIDTNDRSYLFKDKFVTLESNYTSVELVNVLKVISAQTGLQIVPQVDLAKISYNGSSFRNAPAESVLRFVTGAAGLDYEVDAEKSLIYIKGAPTRTWYLNLGNRTAQFKNGGSSMNPLSASDELVTSSSGTTTTTSTATTAASSGSTGDSSISLKDDIWKSLETELKARLTQAPTTGTTIQAASAQASSPASAALPGMMPSGVAGGVSASSAAATSGTGTTAKQMGVASLNPETGAITITAPSWMMKDLDTYMKKVIEMYNTRIVLEGRVVLVARNNQQTEGVDLSAFGTMLKGQYGFGVVNNSLGGITFNPTSNSFSTSNTSLPSSVLAGITGNGLQIVNGFLESQGIVATIEKPVVATSSGLLGEFSNLNEVFYNTVTQDSSSTSSSSTTTTTSAPAIKNSMYRKTFGVSLRVNPRYDVSTGLIRAQLDFKQRIQKGYQTVPQILTTTSGTTTVNAAVPKANSISYSGELLLKDGDTIVVGGQETTVSSSDRDGVLGLLDTPVIDQILAKGSNTVAKATYYLIIKVSLFKE